MSDSLYSPENTDASYDIVIQDERKKFICKYPYCGKVFRFKSEIERHVTIHSATRPYECPYDNCIKTFKRSDALDNHIRCSHTREASYFCHFPGCEMKFAAHGSFRHHIQKNHKTTSEGSSSLAQSSSAQPIKKIKMNPQTTNSLYAKQSPMENDNLNQSQLSSENDLFSTIQSYKNIQYQVANDDTVSSTETSKSGKSERMNQITEENTALKERLMTNEQTIKCMQNQITKLLSGFFTCQFGTEAKSESSTFSDLKDSFREDFLESSKGEQVTLTNIMNSGEEINFFASDLNCERQIDSCDSFLTFGSNFEF